MIHARTGEGRARAVMRGEETFAETGQGYAVSGWTISRLPA